LRKTPTDITKSETIDFDMHWVLLSTCRCMHYYRSGECL